MPCILSRELTDFSLPKIGEEFGGRDHTTVIHAHEKISKLLQTDSQFQRQIKEIQDTFKSHNDVNSVNNLTLLIHSLSTCG